MSKDESKIRIGVIGAGAMGVNHVRILSNMSGVSFQGLYDPDPDRSERACALHGCRSYQRVEELLDQCRAVSIAAPTYLHHELGLICLERGIHVLMEKPLADNLANAEALVRTADEKRLVLMVGHIERHNPAIMALMDRLADLKERVVAISAQRLAPFDGTRCMDTDVLYDLLIHDMDLVLEIAGAPIKRVHAAGKAVFSATLDSAQVLMEFENSVTATLWAGRCSPHKVRELMVTTEGHFFRADTLDKTLLSCKAPIIPDMERGVCSMGMGEREGAFLDEKEPLVVEFEEFLSAVTDKRPPLVHGQRALEAMRALQYASEAMSSGREE
jgi:predicted dehydrogenase